MKHIPYVITHITYLTLQYIDGRSWGTSDSTEDFIDSKQYFMLEYSIESLFG
jgi:hypothetical protein